MAQFDRVMYWALILTHEGLSSEMLLGYSFLSVPIVGDVWGGFHLDSCFLHGKQVDVLR